MDNTFTSYIIEERSFVSYFKREIHQQVFKEKFPETRRAEIDIIVSELCSNLIKHVGKGELLYRIMDHEDDKILEMISIDKGPGIADTARMMKDGVSTTKTLGQGLGAIHRLSDLTQLYTVPGWGTILFTQVNSSSQKNPKKVNRVEARALFVSKPRETDCGDGYRIKHTDTEVMIFFGDGLGHGEHAKEAVDQAGNFFFESKETDPVDLIRQMHEKVRRTRGLVGTVAARNKISNEWRICGVGNILTRMYTGISYKNYLPYNGTIGLNLPASMNASIIPCERNQHLIMCSDGLQTRWDLSKYPSILKYDTIVLAAAIYKDFNRGNDDSSILIVNVK